MKKTLILSLLIFLFTISACAPQANATTVPLPATEPAVFAETQTPIPVSPTETGQSMGQKVYTNSTFGFGFQFPSDWFGPEEYISEQDLRVEIGSDKVYPYGTDPAERIYELNNSYTVLIQYSKSNQNQYETDPSYQSLLNLKDGESLSGTRSLLIRVRQLEIGRFKGFEYITTLSETGQTDRFYTRSVMLFDEQSNNTITIMGQPINVEVSNDANWRDVYRMIDEANLTLFHDIVESITVE